MELFGLAESDLRRVAFLSRKSGQTWLVTVEDMLHYQKGCYWPDATPNELKPSFNRALAQMKGDD